MNQHSRKLAASFLVISASVAAVAIHVASRSIQSRLAEALDAGDWPRAKKLLVWRPFADGRTREAALSLAASAGDTAEVERGLLSGRPVDAENMIHQRLLYLAACNGKLDTVRLLLGRGAQIDAYSQRAEMSTVSETALSGAERHSHTEAAEFLLSQGANPMLYPEDKVKVGVNPELLNPPLVDALRHPDPKHILSLLAHGADPNGRSAVGQSALMDVCGSIDVPEHRLAIAKILVNAGADTNAQNLQGASSLEMVSATGDISIAQLLIDHGAKIDQVDSDLATPLVTACRNGHFEIARLLIAHGARSDATTREQQTTLGAATMLPDTSPDKPLLIALLKKQGAHLSLSESVVLENQEEIRWRLAHGSSPNDLCSNGSPMLSLAATCRSSEPAALLLGAGARVDAVDEIGWTPLMVACSNGHGDTVRLLLNHGADARKQNRSGRSAASLMEHLNEPMRRELLALLSGQTVSSSDRRTNGLHR